MYNFINIVKKCWNFFLQMFWDFAQIFAPPAPTPLPRAVMSHTAKFYYSSIRSCKQLLRSISVRFSSVEICTLRHGRRKGGLGPPLNFEIISQKRLFFQFQGVKTNFTTFAPPWKKFWENPLLLPQEKILPTPVLYGFEFRAFIPGRRQRGGQWCPAPPIWNRCNPISHLAYRLLHTSNVAPLSGFGPSWFLPPLAAKSWWRACIYSSYFLVLDTVVYLDGKTEANKIEYFF